MKAKSEKREPSLFLITATETGGPAVHSHSTRGHRKGICNPEFCLLWTGLKTHRQPESDELPVWPLALSPKEPHSQSDIWNFPLYAVISVNEEKTILSL